MDRSEPKETRSDRAENISVSISDNEQYALGFGCGYRLAFQDLLYWVGIVVMIAYGARLLTQDRG